MKYFNKVKKLMIGFTGNDLCAFDAFKLVTNIEDLKQAAHNMGFSYVEFLDNLIYAFDELERCRIRF